MTKDFSWIVLSIFSIFTYCFGFFLKRVANLQSLIDDIVKNILLITSLVSLLGIVLLFCGAPWTDIGMGFITFASVSFGLWLSSENKRIEVLRANKTTARLQLSLILSELLQNLHILETVKPNYRFLTNDIAILLLSVEKFEKLLNSINNFKSDAFNSFNSSNSALSINSQVLGNVKKSDEILHYIWTSYKEIFLLRSYFQQMSSNFDLKLKTLTLLSDNKNNTIPSGFLESFRADFDAGARELAIARRFLIKAHKLLSDSLSELGIKTEIEAREDYLDEEDREFINSVSKIPSADELSKPFKEPVQYDNPI